MSGVVDSDWLIVSVLRIISGAVFHILGICDLILQLAYNIIVIKLAEFMQVLLQYRLIIFTNIAQE